MSAGLALHLARLHEAASQARAYVQSMERDAFLADRKTQQAVVLNLLVIGETVNRLHDEDTAFVGQLDALRPGTTGAT